MKWKVVGKVPYDKMLKFDIDLTGGVETRVFKKTVKTSD